MSEKVSHEFGSAMRYQDLKPEVQTYVDRLKAQIKESYLELGVSGIKELRKKYEDGARVTKEDLEKAQRILSLTQRLEKAVEKDEVGFESEYQEREEKSLRAFFGDEVFDKEIKTIPPLPPEATPEKIEFWKENKFELHYLPAMDMAEKDTEGNLVWKKPPGWAKPLNKPPSERGVIHALKCGWRLMDMREKPAYAEGAQMYEDDLLIGEVLERLRHTGSIAPYQYVSNPKSRIGISATELAKPEVKHALAQALGVNTVDLPSALENNILMHIHLPSWGDANTWEWFLDKDDADRLFGGNSDGGGLSDARWYDTDSRGLNLGFRSLVHFSS